MVSLVTKDGWCVSGLIEPDVPGYTLRVFRVISEKPYKTERGFGDGVVFASREDANEFCLTKGYLQCFVETDAFRRLVCFYTNTYGAERARQIVRRDYGDDAIQFIQ